MAFLRVKELRTPSNILIFNLALADLSFSCDTLAYASYLRYWPFGSQGCQIHAFQGMISILATISFLCDVAWDRYHMYCTKQKMVWSTSLTLSTIMWSLAVFWAALTLPFIGWGVLDYEPMKVGCTLYYTTGDRSSITYMVSVMVLYLAFPMLFMYACYSSIYAYFKKTHNFKTTILNKPAVLGPLILLLLIAISEILQNLLLMTVCTKPFFYSFHEVCSTNVQHKSLLFFWGPYMFICMYACFENTKLLSPKLRIIFPVLAKMTPQFFNSLLYVYRNEFYRGGIWHFLTGQKQSDKKTDSLPV